MNHDALHHLWWLASRSAGMVAFGLAAFSVILGLTMSTGMSARKRAARRDLHEQVALASLAALALHGAFLFGDRWLRPGVLGVLVPFTMSYRTPFTGLGVIAGYVAVLLGLTYYLRGRIGPRRWRSLHRLTPLVYVLAAIHALGAGADRATLGLRLAVIGSAVPIVALLVVRVAPSVRSAWDALEPADSPAITPGPGSRRPAPDSQLG